MGKDYSKMETRTDAEIEQYIRLQQAEAARSGLLSFTGAACSRNAKDAAMRLAMRRIAVIDPNERTTEH